MQSFLLVNLILTINILMYLGYTASVVTIDDIFVISSIWWFHTHLETTTSVVTLDDFCYNYSCASTGTAFSFDLMAYFRGRVAKYMTISRMLTMSVINDNILLSCAYNFISSHSRECILYDFEVAGSVHLRKVIIIYTFKRFNRATVCNIRCQLVEFHHLKRLSHLVLFLQHLGDLHLFCPYHIRT